MLFVLTTYVSAAEANLNYKQVKNDVNIGTLTNEITQVYIYVLLWMIAPTIIVSFFGARVYRIWVTTKVSEAAGFNKRPDVKVLLWFIVMLFMVLASIVVMTVAIILVLKAEK